MDEYLYQIRQCFGKRETHTSRVRRGMGENRLLQLRTDTLEFSPTQEDFRNSRKAFEDVLKDMQPNFIIFWGHRLWNNFEKDNYSVENGINYLTYNGIKYPFLVVPHPSSSAFGENTYSEIHKFIHKIQS